MFRRSASFLIGRFGLTARRRPRRPTDGPDATGQTAQTARRRPADGPGQPPAASPATDASHLHRDPFKGSRGVALAGAVCCTDGFDVPRPPNFGTYSAQAGAAAPRSSPPLVLATLLVAASGARVALCVIAVAVTPRPLALQLDQRRPCCPSDGYHARLGGDLMYDDLAWQPMTEDQRSGSSIAHRHHLGSCIDDRRSDWVVVPQVIAARKAAVDRESCNRALLLGGGTGESSCTAIYSPSARGQRARVEISMRARFRRWKVESAPPELGGGQAALRVHRAARQRDDAAMRAVVDQLRTTYATKFGSCRRAPATTSGLGR